MKKIMDPKMDSGRVAEGDDFEELYDVTELLTANKVLGIMDQLLCLEVNEMRPFKKSHNRVLLTRLRCHGTWAIHCRKLFSLASTLRHCLCLIQLILAKLSLGHQESLATEAH